MKKFFQKIFLCLAISAAVLLSSCAGKSAVPSADGSFVVSGSKETLRILSGSENKELEPVIKQFAEENKISVLIDYKGSLDIMRALQEDTIEYDAVWPASSLWISLGDEAHRVKHIESISITPVVFGIKKSLAESLGFVGKDVSVSDILSATADKKLNFCMTSVTQSNSGASAYMGFLYALLGNPDVITSEDLDKSELQEKITELLSGVNRSSGSSDWLKEMFLQGSYDAMVNYECLIISANKELEAEGKEPLYVVYPYDGLSIADSPLGYVDNSNQSKEEAFLSLQEYLLSDSAQDSIQKTGRRTGYTGVSESNKEVFNPDWGVDSEKILSPIKMPSSDVIFKALNLYQTQFKKPSLNVYCLDYSGSMEGEGNAQLVSAMEQILIQEKAEKNFLQATKDEVNIVIMFDDTIIDTYTTDGKDYNLEDLYTKIRSQRIMGGTNIYNAVSMGLNILGEYDLSKYTPAIILMTDGCSEGDLSYIDYHYKATGFDVPVFSIMFGSADDTQLNELATLTNAKVFDGRKDLIDAFRKVKGYN